MVPSLPSTIVLQCNTAFICYAVISHFGSACKYLVSCQQLITRYIHMPGATLFALHLSVRTSQKTQFVGSALFLFLFFYFIFFFFLIFFYFFVRNASSAELFQYVTISHILHAYPPTQQLRCTSSFHALPLHNRYLQLHTAVGQPIRTSSMIGAAIRRLASAANEQHNATPPLRLI